MNCFYFPGFSPPSQADRFFFPTLPSQPISPTKLSAPPPNVSTAILQANILQQVLKLWFYENIWSVILRPSGNACSAQCCRQSPSQLSPQCRTPSHNLIQSTKQVHKFQFTLKSRFFFLLLLFSLSKPHPCCCRRLRSHRLVEIVCLQMVLFLHAVEATESRIGFGNSQHRLGTVRLDSSAFLAVHRYQLIIQGRWLVNERRERENPQRLSLLLYAKWTETQDLTQLRQEFHHMRMTRVSVGHDVLLLQLYVKGHRNCF